MSPEKVSIGVGCGDGTQFTPLSESEALASWQPSSGTKC